MSGIYIKGMKLSAEPGVHKIRLFVRDNGTASALIEEYIPHKPLEVIPVPDHGDLIDRNALMQHEVFLSVGGGYLPLVYASYVRNAPAIIPEDKEVR